MANRLLHNEIEKLCLECVLPRCIETHPRCLIKIARAEGLEAARTAISEAHHKIVIMPPEKPPAAVPVKQAAGKRPKPRLRLVKRRKLVVRPFSKPLKPVKQRFHAPSFSDRFPLCVVVRNPASFKIATSAEGVTCRKCLRDLPRYRRLIQFVLA